MRERQYPYIIGILPYLIPLIVFFDWLFSFEVTKVQIGVYLKGFATLLFIYVFLHHRFSAYYFKNILLYFLGIYLIYSIFSDSTFEYLYLTVRVAFWVLGSLAFYYFFLNDLISQRQLRLMFLLITFIACLFTFILMSRSDTYQNANAYLLLWCLPLLFLFKQSKLVQLAIIISIVAIVLTIKRGAILALIMSLFLYFIAMNHISEKKISKIKITLTSLFIAGVISLVLYLNWEIVTERMADRTGSGRVNLYTAIIKNYIRGDIIDILFGHGINSVQKLTTIVLAKKPGGIGVAAHSDWLQYMSDFGFFGLLFMFLFHFKFIKLIRFHLHHKTSWLPPLLLTYTIFTLTTVYSFILNSPNAIFLGIFIALLSVETNRIKYEINDVRII
ncbi:MAG TPA: O-antigen ligase family protein [Bacteroidales bacterium]|nr:O-antigen ligase family protein [Bacteroidales bacterium]